MPQKQIADPLFVKEEEREQIPPNHTPPISVFQNRVYTTPISSFSTVGNLRMLDLQ